MQDAFAISSLASASWPPSLYALGRYSKMSLAAFIAMPLVKSVAIMDAIASRAWVSASIPDAAVSPLGMLIMRSASMIAMSGKSS